MKRILVYGYGNPGRQDDGLGPALIEMLEAEGIPGVETDCNYQLQIEDAEAVSRFDAVVFVDASIDGEGPFSYEGLEPSAEIAFTTHAMSPASVLALCHELYRTPVPAFLLGIRGYRWEPVEGLSEPARENLESAFGFIRSRLVEMTKSVTAGGRASR
jgi:hydrogenase maturation protease